MGSIKQIPFDLFVFHVLLTLHAYYFTYAFAVDGDALLLLRQLLMHGHNVMC